ncbi:MAG: heavy-metal-associated domain-containing protein [Bacteroidales bacterium]
METLRFKTNLKCSGCISAIKPSLENIAGIGDWKVDLSSPERILEIDSPADKAEEILEAVKKAGYEINQLP